VKVVGAGFGRTGTMSLKAALETLGFGPCYHMIEVFEHPEHAGFWQAAWRGEPVDWDGLLGGYEAAVDWPACTFYEELLQRYPDARVLLSVRDPERWYESTRDTIYQISKITAGSRLSRAVFAFVGLFVSGVFEIGRMGNKIIWQGTFDGRFEDRSHAIEVFVRHNEEVKRRVPAEKLLVFEVKEGWGPLCEFLGVEAPDKPFPRLNDAAQMRRRIRAVQALSLAGPAVLALLATVALALLGRRARR
jgi:sulfotransferase family protein